MFSPPSIIRLILISISFVAATSAHQARLDRRPAIIEPPIYDPEAYSEPVPYDDASNEKSDEDSL